MIPQLQARAKTMWLNGLNTADIGKALHVAEHLIERWRHRWREDEFTMRKNKTGTRKKNILSNHEVSK